MILGVDPGTTQTAFALLAPSPAGPCIMNRGIVPNLRMARMLSGIAPSVNMVAIEVMQSYGMSVGKEVFETLIWIGRFREMIKKPRIMPCFRKNIVVHHCKSPTAGDTHVRASMIARFGPKGTKAAPGPTFGFAADMWSALAIGSYASDVRASGRSFPSYAPFAELP